jgi:hypothetical protein
VTDKTLTGAYPGGYPVNPAVSLLNIATSSTVGGTGVSASKYLTIASYGVIAAVTSETGIVLHAGGDVTIQAGASVSGTTGVAIYDTGSVRNFGAISGTFDNEGDIGGEALMFSGLGEVQNGARSDTTAVISGEIGIDATGGVITNYATISATDLGVDLGGAGATVTNFQSGVIDATADGVDAGAASVTNLGTILAISETFASYTGVYVGAGSVSNGSAEDTTALIEGVTGTRMKTTGSITNFGTIIGTHFFGAYLLGGGALTNGGATDSGALIEGSSGVRAAANANPATITNLGAIRGQTGAGIGLYCGGAITNGSMSDVQARISGYTGIAANKAPATVANFGAIEGAGVAGNFGIELGDGGAVTNGAVTDPGASIRGYVGVSVAGATGVVTNFGTIAGAGPFGSPAISLAAGGQVTNGGGTDRVALIDGVTGIDLSGAGTVANFATVDGETGYGVVLFGPSEVTNGSGTDHAALIEGYIGVELKSGGSIANFGTIASLGGTHDGAYLNGGSITNGAVTDTTALLAGYYGLRLEAATGANFGMIQGQGGDGGEGAYVAAGSSLTNEAAGVVDGYTGVVVSGVGTLTNFGAIVGAAGTAVEFGSSADVLIVEAGASFVGAVSGDGGVLDLASGSDTITEALSGSGVTIAGVISAGAFNDFATLNIGAGATVTLSGKITVSSTVAVSGKLLVASGTSLIGTGAVVLTDNATNEITGATSTSLLTNDTRIEGEGQLGDGAMELTNAASGSIYSLGAGSLTLNTGTSTILNAGAIVSEGTGGLTISSPIDNTGELIAYSSPLTVSGAVTGTGTAELENAGTLILKGAFNENVTFASGSTGALKLGDSKGYTTGSITGFSKTGANALDLLDIPFVSGTTTATYTGSATSGVLTVKDGASVAAIHLTGDYLGSTFTVSASPAGGTKVVDPAKPAATPPHLSAPLAPRPAFAPALFAQTLAAFDPAMGRDASALLTHALSPILATQTLTHPA